MKHFSAVILVVTILAILAPSVGVVAGQEKVPVCHLNGEGIYVRIEIADEVESVLVDSAQIVSAIANIISNAAESYGDETGPIAITAGADEDGKTVRLAIRDQGCGMDAATLKKATQPFFSARPAGRKRGMGLAYAARFIQLNVGRLEIASEPDSGTTVTIRLPSE